jgi:uncharacterized membrane protein
MKKSEKAIVCAITGLLALGGSSADALVNCAEQERCYGVARAGKNDCATSTSVCASTAKQDFQKDAWIFVPKGTCTKLAGGSLQPKTEKKQ